MESGGRQTSGAAVRWAMVAVVISFSGGTLFTQYLLRSEVEATDITGNAAPGIALLADARADLRAVERAAREHAGYADQRRRLDDTLARYRATPDYPGESDLYAPVPGLLSRLDERVAASAAADELVDQIDGRLRQLGELNRARLRDSVAALVRRERLSNRWAFVLDAVAIGIAILATWLAMRTLDGYLATLQRRNRELEMLAVQVGHEIANPLIPLQAAVALGAEHAPQTDAPAFDRAARSLERIRFSLDRLVRFAESTRPPPAPITPAPLRAALEGLEVEVQGELDTRVACNAATLAGLVRDLVAAARPSRISVKRTARGARLFLDGSGAGSFDPELFDEHSGRPGIDLRLAGVRRRVEAHGGSVGRSNGTLWIELPAV